LLLLKPVFFSVRKKTLPFFFGKYNTSLHYCVISNVLLTPALVACFPAFSHSFWRVFWALQVSGYRFFFASSLLSWIFFSRPGPHETSYFQGDLDDGSCVLGTSFFVALCLFPDTLRWSCFFSSKVSIFLVFFDPNCCLFLLVFLIGLLDFSFPLFPLRDETYKLAVRSKQSSPARVPA